MKQILKRAPKKSKDDVVIDGICAGIAKEFDIDPFWTRLGAVILIPLTAGFMILFYIVLMVIMDKEADVIKK